MLDEGIAHRKILRAMAFHRHGVTCPAVFWDAVTGALESDGAARVLAGLPEPVRRELRAIREERPWSLRSEVKDDATRREIERWCVAEDHPTSASDEV